MGCGRYLGGAVGYRRICGGLWMGSISKCDNCEEKELKRRVLEKQEQLLDKQLAESLNAKKENLKKGENNV